MRNSSYAPHYAISRYSIREFNTGAEPFMVAMIIIIIIICFYILWIWTGFFCSFINFRGYFVLVDAIEKKS